MSSPRRRAGGFDAVFLAIGAHIGKRTADPRARRRQGPRRDSRSSRGVAKGAAPEARPPRRHLRRRQHGDGRRARREAPRATSRSIIYRRDREHMPAHPFEADEAIEEGVRDPLAPHHQGDRRARRSSSRSWSSTTRASRGRTGRTETLEADSLVLALGQDVDTSFLQRRRRASSREGRRRQGLRRV